jgi:hypothetical protein
MSRTNQAIVGQREDVIHMKHVKYSRRKNYRGLRLTPIPYNALGGGDAACGTGRFIPAALKVSFEHWLDYRERNRVNPFLCHELTPSGASASPHDRQVDSVREL